MGAIIQSIGNNTITVFQEIIGDFDCDNIDEDIVIKFPISNCSRNRSLYIAHNPEYNISTEQISRVWETLQEKFGEIGPLPQGDFVINKNWGNFGSYSGQIKLKISDESNEYVELNHGYGIIKFADRKTEYFGMWDDDKPNGKGILRFSENHYYKGDFRKGHFEGQGKYKNGRNYYKGSWKKSLKHGYGEEKINGEKYCGFFRKGEKHGDGRIITRNGTFEGVFSRNNLKTGSYVSRNNDILYDGDWNGNEPNGRGFLKIRHNSLNSVQLNGKFRSGYFKKGSLTLYEHGSIDGSISNISGEYYFTVKCL